MWTGCLHSSQEEGRGRGAVIPYCKGGSVRYEFTISKTSGVSWCCGHYCLLAFVLWCGYCSVSFQSFVLRHWCPQHQETTKTSLKDAIISLRGRGLDSF